MKCIDRLMQSVCSWKARAVQEYGIGSDLPIAVYAFTADDDLLGYATMGSGHDGRIAQRSAVAEVATAMRRGWQAFAIAVVYEGYVTSEPDDGSGRQLDELFATGNPAVSEALITAYLDAEGRAAVTAYPYSQALGRTVVWDVGAIQQLQPACSPYSALLDEAFVRIPLAPLASLVSLDQMLSVSVEIAQRGWRVFGGSDQVSWEIEPRAAQ